jgi:putative glutamine amidotransferase
MSARPRIGVSACFFHADPDRPIFTGKTLQYVEQSAAHWLMAGGALPVMIPSPAGDTFRGDVTLGDYADWLDGLLLEGGSDLWPGSYGEEPLQERWSGDRIRDEYERALVEAFVARGKPVFGICRGLQLLNVAFGGTLYQDIATQRPDALVHRDSALYDRCRHDVEVMAGTRLGELLGGERRVRVNSVHHQAIRNLAPGFEVEATCPDDGIIEAIRRDSGSFVAAVQWHPEFHRSGEGTLDDTPLLEDFLAAARTART